MNGIRNKVDLKNIRGVSGNGREKRRVEARNLEHGFRRISARIPYTLPSGHEDNDVPTFWLLL